jgi:serine/threonine-protein kinase
VGSRYEIRSQIGRGGMAAVFEAHDLATDRRVALKRILATEESRNRRRAVELFEREYQVLAQLAHPRIVQVYDYAVDDEGPYYTMELLDGGDLHRLAPLDWRKTCAVGRDVCSALSLLHSRRMVYRDLSARNVRCTASGLAKLIDFGAMAPMGTSNYVLVGTPAYSAPEMLQLMALDARADLFALGATLYYALTGRHAYPARDFAGLPEHWERTPARPSQFHADIPEALDSLVLDLLCLDPSGRPATAAEVMERLGAIEGSGAAEQGLVAQAYLSTPNLVGRAAGLTRVASRTSAGARGLGSVLTIAGVSGVGRSRFLDACVLDAKIQGVLVLRANAVDAKDGEYGAVRALAKALIAAMPEVARELAQANLATLGQLLPELLLRAEPAPEGAGEVVRARLQVALREWFLLACQKKPLFIAVDDVHRLDEPSLAWLSLLSQNVKSSAITLVATLESGADATSAAALKLLLEKAQSLELHNLDAEDTEKLLASIFGDVPNVSLVAARIFGVSKGNPRDTLRLAQHLLDRAMVRYHAGVWSLPAQVDTADLPGSMAQALTDCVAALSPDARVLAQAMALCPGLSVTFEECLVLQGHHQSGRVAASVEELITAEILRYAGERFELSQQTWATILRQGMEDAETRERHLRLANLYERRGVDPFRFAQHLIRGGDGERGVRTLAVHAEASEQQTGKNPEEFFRFVQSLPPDWFETYEEALALCDTFELPKTVKRQLLSRLSGLLSVGGASDKVYLPALVSQLRADSGLMDWENLDADMEPMTRLMTAMAKVRERFAEAPEHERGLDPPTAIRGLARALIQVSAVVTSALDIPGARSLPSLAPLAPLSPALGVIHRMMQGMMARMAGRAEQAQSAYAEVLSRTDEPDRGGLDESHHKYMRLGLMSGMGMIEASMGLRSSLDWAARLEAEPLYQVNAMQVRMLYHLWQGDVREAGLHKRQVDMLRIQNSARQFFEGTHLIWQIVAYAVAEDLTRTKQTLEEIEGLCQRYPGWIPVRCYGSGEFHRIRGDLPQAIREIEAGLRMVRAGEHQIWANLAGAHLRILGDLGRSADALRLGEEYAQSAESANLGHARSYVLMPLSLIQSKFGQPEAALKNVSFAIDDLEARGSTGLVLGLAYETRARVALAASDQSAFDRYAALCTDVLRAPGNPALLARCERLARDARRANGVDTLFTSVLAPVALGAHSRMRSQLACCKGARERAESALSWLAQAVGATDGYLLLVTSGGLASASQLGARELPADVRALAEEYLTEQCREADTTTDGEGSASLANGSWCTEQGEAYRPVLVAHSTPAGLVVTGVAILVFDGGMRFSVPAEIAAEVSLSLVQAGDASGRLVAS